MLDAADMAAAPGSLGLLRPEQVKGQRYSTHAMPLSLVMDYLEKELGAAVVLVGIQPDPVRPGDEGAPSKNLAKGLRRLKSAVSKATRSLF
jgi:hydrogenase 3 maturation protease